MDIMFEIVSRQKFSATFPTAHVFGEAGGYIGRSSECEWVLPDKSKHISRKHALVTFEDDAFYIEDVSANGVFLSLGNEPVGRGSRHRIEHGEGFVIGGYTIMARLLHNPRAYAASSHTAEEDILSFSQPLSLNPLTAMEQEEEMIARQRLGDYDDLLGQRSVQTVLPGDHTDPRISRLQPMVAVAEYRELIPADWDADPDEEEEDFAPAAPPPVPPVSRAPARPVAQAPVPPVAQAPVAPVAQPPVPPVMQAPAPPPPMAPASLVQKGREPSPGTTEAFFRELGFAEAPASAAEQERVMLLTAALLRAAVNGLTRALQNRNECKNELRLPMTTMGLGVSNNPLKFSPTPEAAMATLLGVPQKGVLAPVESVLEGFQNLHSHHMGLIAGARAAVRASLEKVAPKVVEARLDADGPVRFNRNNRLWHTFIRMHQSLQDDHEGFAALFLQDFARAYEVQGRTLNPSLRDTKGEQS